jgi:hypothetical protein
VAQFGLGACQQRRALVSGSLAHRVEQLFDLT